MGILPKQGWAKPLVVLAYVLGGLVVMGAVLVGLVGWRVYTAYRIFFGPHPSAAVACAPTGPGIGEGFTCIVDHRGGARLHVCWRLLATCRNGHTMTAGECTDVEEGSRSRVSVPLPKEAEPRDCDEIRSTRIETVDASEAP